MYGQTQRIEDTIHLCCIHCTRVSRIYHWRAVTPHSQLVCHVNALPRFQILIPHVISSLVVSVEAIAQLKSFIYIQSCHETYTTPELHPANHVSTYQRTLSCHFPRLSAPTPFRITLAKHEGQRPMQAYHRLRTNAGWTGWHFPALSPPCDALRSPCTALTEVPALTITQVILCKKEEPNNTTR